jgi:hypothetical protein
MSVADELNYGGSAATCLSGRFFDGATGRCGNPNVRTLTTLPTFYWLRNPNEVGSGSASVAQAAQGDPSYNLEVTTAYGLRPAGVFLSKVAQCLLAANISLRKLFRLENADK